MRYGLFSSLRSLLALLLALATGLGGLAVLGTADIRIEGGPHDDGRAREGAALIAERVEDALLSAGRDLALIGESLMLQPPEAIEETAERMFAVWRRLHPEYADVLLADRTVSTQPRLADRATAFTARLTAAARESWTATVNWAQDQVREPEIEVGPQASLIVGQGLPGRDPSGLLTVFTAPNAASLQASALCLTTPSIWSRIEGRVATLDGEEGTLSVYEAKQVRLLESGPTSIGNLRLVVAGWFSTNPSLFVLILFAAAVSLGLSTSAMLRDVGRANGSPGGAPRGDDRRKDR